MKRSLNPNPVVLLRLSRGKIRASNSLRSRISCFESLEDRMLLSVTPAEYADIRATYAEFNLPESMNDINVIEVTADELSSENVRTAVAQAGASSGADLIVIRTTATTHRIEYASSIDEITVSLNSSDCGVLSIVGYGTTSLTINANGYCRLLSVGNQAKVNLGNLVLTGGNSGASSLNAGYGGALYNSGRLTASCLTFIENCSSYCGGGVFNSGTMKFTNVEIVGNSAVAAGRANGGGIYSSGTITGVNVLVADNSVSGTTAYGGGIYLWSGKFIVEGATITGNSAGVGGGFYLFGSSSIKYSLGLNNSILVGNSAGDSVSGEIYRYNSKGMIAGNHVLTDWSDWDTSVSIYAYDPSMPLFANAPAGLYTPTSDSQAIDIGNNALVSVLTDLSGETRIVNGIVDLGAYEYQTDAKPDITDVSVIGWSGYYDGEAHTITVIDPSASTDTIIYTYNGLTYDMPPEFTAEGTYTVSVTVSRDGYNDWQSAASVVILPVSTDLTVTTNLDVVDETDGLCSLREAIALIENGSAESTRITFSSDVFTGGDANTITLTLGELAITKSMTIDASALSDFVTIDAAGESRVFFLEGKEDAAIVFTGLVITGGAVSKETGAGLYVKSGDLTLTRSIVTENTAAIGSGGGVYLEGGALTARNTEFSANTAAIGAGVYAAGGTFTAVNCTIAGNAATNYGGGVANWSTVVMTNTIVSNNFGYMNNCDWFGLAADTSSANNIIGFDAEFVAAAEFDGEGNITNLDSIDLTISSSGWGIDRGLNSAVTDTVDLAGNTRVAQSWKDSEVVDIGAYEYQGTISRETETASTTVTTLLDLVDDTDGFIALREAILYAEAGGSVDFAESLAGQTISLSDTALVIDKQISIDASDLDGGITVDGNAKTSVMLISGGAESTPVLLKGLTITGGNSYDGGGILSSGHLEIQDSTLHANGATNGSAIFSFRGAVSLKNVTVSKNTKGGAIYSYYGTLNIEDSSFTENSGARGGALYLSRGTVTIADSTFTGNTANYGGAIHNVGATLTISGSTISGGGSYYGGAICNYGVTTLANAIISGNNAYYNGGGVYNYLGTLTATNTLFYENTGGYGGAICADGSVLTAINCTIAGNESNYGGGIFAHGVASDDDSKTYVITLCNTIIADNTAVNGSDIHVNNTYGTIAGVYSLSSFTDWTNTATNYGYDATKRLFRDPDNNDYQLASGGQAIDVGGNAFVSGVPTDLDGNTRIVNNIVDLGAYEFQRSLETPSAVVTTEQDVVDPYDGLISLREAIGYMEGGSAGGDTITFDPYLQGKTITLDEDLGGLEIAEAITIDATTLRGGLSVDGGGLTRVFFITGGSTFAPVTLCGVRVTGGAAENGGGIRNEGVLLLEDCLVAENTAARNGGGIWNRGELTVRNTTVTSNTASAGAGIWSESANMVLGYETVLQNSVVAANTLTEGGTGNADIGKADQYGSIYAFYTLSSYSDWSNVSDADVANYAYDDSLPLFADAANSEYALVEGSQAIDLGLNDYLTVDTDLAGNARVINGVVDLGAYEYLYNADPGDILTQAKVVAFTDDSYVIREKIGNGLYGDKDVDFYAVDVTDEDLTRIFSFTVTPSEEGESLGTLIRVFDSEGTQLGGSGSTPILSWTPSETGRFYFAISALENSEYDPASTDERPSGETGTYKFTIAHADRNPITGIKLTEKDPTVGLNISVTVEPKDALVTYQWVRGTDPETLEEIDGATNYYYEVTTADVGCYIGVIVTGYNTSVGSLTAMTDSTVPEFTKSLVVTTLLDTADSADGLVSLREAIAYADAGETITFDESLNGGTIFLGDYSLVISKQISVDASSLADGIAVSAGGKHRILMNTAGELGSSVTITNVNFRDGTATYGGGIYNSGYLDLVKSSVSDCSAYYGGGIYNLLDAGSSSVYGSGYVGLTDSTVRFCTATNAGGGVWNEMGIVVTKYTQILSNTAQIGGGLYNYYGSCSSTDTLIASNSASRYGGGVCIDQGVFYFQGTTITANSAAYGGGVYNYSSSESFPYKTEYYNSLIVGNTATRSGNDFYNDGSGEIMAYSAMSGFTDWSNADAVYYVYDSGNAMFADADQGDFSLAEDSQAIDIGNNTYSTYSTDLAGNPRISHLIIDLGAYEYQFEETTELESVFISLDSDLRVDTVITASVLPEEAQVSDSVIWTWYRGESLDDMHLIDGATASSYTVTRDDHGCYLKVSAAGIGRYTGTVTIATSTAVPILIDPLVVTTAEDVIDASDELVSLREAILAAQDGDTITFSAELVNSTITLDSELGELVIEKSIAIDASALCNMATMAPRLTVSANASQGESRRVFAIGGGEESKLTVSITGLKITGGRAEVTAGGSEAVQADGGGIYASHVDLTLDRCTVTQNVVRSTATTGDAFATGGGICLTSGSLVLMNSTVTSNSLYAYSESGIVETLGGGIHAAGEVIITNTTISGHYASAGGGIYLESGSLSVSGSTLSTNRCKIVSDANDNVVAYGGGIFASSGDVIIRSSALRGNSVSTESVSGMANAQGGGVYIDSTATLLMEDVTLTANSVEALTGSSTAIALGGGIFSRSMVTLVDVLLAENTVYAEAESAESAGGGIAIYSGSLTATGVTITSNDSGALSGGTSIGAGGGLYVAAGSAALKNTIVALNSGSDGADIFRRNASTVNAYNTLSSYTDWSNSGGTGVQNFVYDNTLPLFVGASGSEYSLAENSQAIDVGENAYVYYADGSAITYDLAGLKRIVNSVVDLGTYEYQTGELTTLDIPANLTAKISGSSSISLTWSNVENASGYELAWKAGAESSWQTQEVSATSLTLDGFTIGDTVRLMVRALGDGILYGDSAFSDVVEKTIAAQTTLSAPPGLDVLDTHDSSAVMLWGVSANASGYELAWKADSWTEWQSQKTAGRNLTVTSLPTDETILFKVRALGDGEYYLDSDYSEEIEVVIGGGQIQLDAPSILTGTIAYYVSYGLNRHLLEWTDVANASGYALAYSTDGGTNWTNVLADETSAVVRNLTYGANIRYKVKALGTGSYTDSSWSGVSTFNVCPMDVNNDGDISFSDRALLSAAWLTEEGDDEYAVYCDIDGNGDVTSSDRAFLALNWLKEASGDDLVYPAENGLLEEIFAEEIDDLLDANLWR
ncbi:MAG: choice-of-anchor Q domain-containing protein [Thermoguttaceae bacterium]